MNSIPAPELIGETVSEEELKPYIEGLKELDSFGADFIAMVCNTVHLFYGRLQNEIGTPVIDLREELKSHLREKSVKSVLVMGTPSTIKQGLYRFEGIRTFEPDEAEIKALSKAIFEFNRGRETGKQIQAAREICHKYLDKGAETVVLGCTELAVMLGGEKIRKINTLDVLVEATVKRFLEYGGL